MIRIRPESGGIGVADNELTNPFPLEDTLVLAARGTTGNFLKVEIEDANGKIVSAILRLEPAYQTFRILLPPPSLSEFDRTKVKEIRFIVDPLLLAANPRDLIKIKVPGLSFIPTLFPTELEELKLSLIEKGINYFQPGIGIDLSSKLPIDRVRPDGSSDAGFKYTQPTLIGFYLQILSEIAAGSIDSAAISRADAVRRMAEVIDALLTLQQNFGWNGLLPWFDLDPTIQGLNSIELGDNANLAQSLAVMIGALEGLTSARSTEELGLVDESLIQSIIFRAELFLDRQEPGYLAFVDERTGLFNGEFLKNSGVFNLFVDRLITEFRGAIAFLITRYPSLPDSVWTRLPSAEVVNYTDRNGNQISGLRSFEGGAFQHFWPLLKNDELSFLDLRNALYNHLIIQTDFAAKNRTPGILSASETLARGYEGKIGIPELAETEDPVLNDLGSTYALAAAYSVNPGIVLEWLDGIRDQLPGLMGNYGLLDSARSDSEIAQIYLGIDVASSVLGLSAAGPDYFDSYLRKRGKAIEYSRLYQAINQFKINRTPLPPALPPAFYDETLSVFDQASGGGAINGFPGEETPVTGSRFVYGTLNPTRAGRYWNLGSIYSARKKVLVMKYSVTDSPKEVILELKDSSDRVFYTQIIAVSAGEGVQELRINLPDSASLEEVKRLALLIDQKESGDLRGDFFIHSLVFRDT